MRLVRLRVESLPGIHPGFELDALDPGVNVVVGPNASGKSSLLRAVRALLYREEQAGAGVLLEAVFQDDGGQLRARRVGDDLRWRRDGREVPPPKLPPPSLLGCYTLSVEDLATGSATEEEIAEQLARALRGGYDIAALTSGPPFRVKANHGQAEQKRLRTARAALARVERDQEDLRRDQARIGRWTQQVEVAEEARRDADAHRRALELLSARREHHRLSAQLGTFPEAMERLVGDEEQRLDALHADLAERTRELDEAREARRAAEARLASSGLAGSPLTAADLEGWRAALRELRRLEGEAAAWEARAREARADLTAARQDLGAVPEALSGSDAARAIDAPDAVRPRLDPASLSTVDQALDGKRAVEAELRQLDHALTALPTEADPQLDRTRLQGARDALLAYLAAPRPRRWWPLRGLGVLLTLGALGGATTLAALGGSAYLPLTGLGLLGLAGLALALRDAGAARARSTAAEHFRTSGIEPPQDWHADAAHRRLLELDEALTQAERLAGLLDERRRTERRREAAQRRLEEIEEGVQAVAAVVGFDPRNLDAGVQRWLRLLDAADRADADLRQATAALAQLGPDRNARAAALDTFLHDNGIAAAGGASSSETLAARLDALAGRLANRNEARRELERADADGARAERERTKLLDEVRALLSGAGLDPGGADATARAAERELRRRLERLGAYRPLREAWQGADWRMRDRAEALAGRADLLALVDADDEGGLQRALADLETTAEAGRDANDRIVATRALIASAEQGRALERAGAEQQAAAEALADRVEEALYAEAGLFLLEAVENEYEQASQPASLQRASDWFRRFTRDQYELRFDGRNATFAAFETASGEQRALSELSTGTRTQLLLAVRIAFAIEAEVEREAEPIPLFLDEALTTADAERFRAVGSSLLLLAREGGRQLFYLTARPEDAALWRADAGPDDQVHVVDIAQARTGAAATAEALSLALPSRAEPPAPDGLSPEAYAAALGVPPVDPWRPPESCHLFHLLRDDLPLLHRLLRVGVERVGTLRTFLDGPTAATLLDETAPGRLRARADGAVAYLRAWRRGRGRPVDRAALEGADGVTAKMLASVAALAGQLGGDARRLLSALEAGEVARYRSDSREQLRDWLELHGYLDERDVLDEAGLRRQVAAAMAARDRDGTGLGGTDALLDEANALTRWLGVGIEAGATKARATEEGSPAGAER